MNPNTQKPAAKMAPTQGKTPAAKTAKPTTKSAGNKPPQKAGSFGNKK